MLYSIKLYIDITTLMYLALSIYVLFISHGFAVGGDTGAVEIVPLTNMYASL